MLNPRVALPDLNALDADTLRAMIVAQHEQLRSRDHEIEHLNLLIAKLQRMQFGRRSEKVARQIEQLELKLEELQSTRGEHALPRSNRPNVADTSSASSKPSRQPLPLHLPREIHRHEPAEPCCPQCGGTLRQLGEDISEVLEYVPASFKVIRHVRPKLSCAGCDVIVQAPAPSRPIERGQAGPGLLAHVITAKYCDHLPLYRQHAMYAREGVEIEDSTLADWIGGCSRLVEPLVEALRRYVLSATKLHADDTPVPVLAPGTGKTKTGRLWTYVRDDRPAADPSAPAVWFGYSPDRKGEHPQHHLRDFAGVLQADAYAGFNALYESGRIREAACWAHVRRKFFDLMEAHRSPIASEAVERIADLYRIEAEIRGRSPDERHHARQSRSRPIVVSMRQWLEASLAKLSTKSDTAAAVRYAFGRWEALSRFLDDGRLEIDNNSAERALRAVAVGRKNYLFAGSDRGGERAASFYTLIGTAKLNGIDPEKYLRAVLERIADHPVNRIEDLQPWNFAFAGPDDQSLSAD